MFETVDYSAANGIARIVLNRPDRLNAINRQLIADLRSAVAAAGDDEAVRVIVLSGAGRAFCAGYDLDWGTKAEDATQRAQGGLWDPVRDYQGMSQNVRAFMSLWESPKSVIAQIHGWCVGGGTDMALCSDLIYMAEDAQIGYPPARVWGEPTTVMWVYRLGLEHAKRLMLTGESLTGRRRSRPPVSDHSSEPARDEQAARQPGLREHGPAHYPAPRHCLRRYRPPHTGRHRLARLCDEGRLPRSRSPP
jgi:enoyl-CoA hydratase/carnithine racemase